MNGGFKDIILEDVYDELCYRYQFAACPPANKQQNTAAAKGDAASSPAKRQPAAPKPPTPPAAPKPKAKKPACGSQPQTAQTYGEQCPPGMYFCTDAKKCKPIPEGKTVTDAGWLVNMSEYDFAKGAGTGKPCGGSHISASYECKLDAGERKSITDGLVSKGASKAKLDKLSDEQISRVSQLVKDKGLSPEQGERVSKGVEKLKEQSGGKKEGGANLQDPGEAKKYSEFYEQKKDLTYKAPYDTDPKVVKATMERLKEEDPAAYSKTVSALNGKGSPTKEQLAEAGWKSSSERGEAVLKSLMDNDFKDVMGQDLSWRQGLQLDHKQAGSTGGTDTPSNWIWISTATNQAKGGMEAAARKKGGSPAEKEEYIRQGLIGKLNKNAQMSAQDVAAAKGAGSARALAKSQEAAALRDNLPLMTPSQRASRISDASAKDMETVLKASVASGKNAETGRKTSYRPVLSGGNGERVRKAYGTAPQMKAIARMRWDEKLSESDLRNIGGVLKASTGSTKSRSDLLNEMLGNFPRSSGLTAAERIAILDAAE